MAEQIEMSAADFMQAAIKGLEGLDHKAVTMRSEELGEICGIMEADGYMFYCAPAANEAGLRTVYFVRHEPELGYRI
jgi:hypothetical protein